MVDHRHRLTSQQKKWLTVRELAGMAPKPTLARRVTEPGLGSDRLSYWQALGLTGVIEDAIQLAEEAMEAADRLQRGADGVADVGGQVNDVAHGRSPLRRL